MPKKTKAIKVTDKSKAWNRKSKPSDYKIGTIPMNKTILIVCEGQTEELYFKSFPVLGVRVDAVNLEGKSKLKMVESIQSIIASSDVIYDEKWCVFDMDIKRGADELSDYDNAIVKAQNLGYKVAYSNDAFELWLYLHYTYSDAENLRTFYYEELSKKFGFNYQKDGKRYDFCLKLYSMLIENAEASQKKAIERAKKLYELKKDLPFHQQNPVTKVFELVEELNRNLRR